MSNRLLGDENRIHLSEITSCPICKVKYSVLGSKNEAKLLTCLDSFCMGCLEVRIRDVTTNYPWSTVSCQLCQTPINVTDLKTNPVVQVLLKIEAITTSPGSKPSYPCDACEWAIREGKETGPASVAEFYCEDCDQKLCVQCHCAHTKLTPTKPHSNVIRLGSEESKTIARKWKEKLPKCFTHNDDEIGEFFCSVCKKFICRTCAEDHIRAHQEQSCMETVKYAIELRRNVNKEAIDVERLRQAAKRKQVTIKEQLAIFIDNVSKTCAEIEERAKMLHEIIERNRKELQDQLVKIRKETDEAFEEAMDSAKRNETRTTRFVKFAELTESVDVSTLYSLYPMLIQRSVDLKKAPCNDSVRLVCVSFAPGIWQETVIFGGKNCLGSIAVDIRRSPPETQTL